jgi:SAM-dependent methyltransferase
METHAETLDQARERLRPYVERARGFSGWMFEEPTTLDPPEPWDYMQEARALIARAHSVLDMGTGGGERFAEICDAYGGRAVATEEWDVNAAVAAARLRPFGIETVRAYSEQLPFADGSFDLVLNRHESLDAAEVGRVLKPGGRFLTQQVTPNYCWELRRFIPRKTQFPDHFHQYQMGLQEAGMTIRRAESQAYCVAFPTLGDLVYLLCIAPWEIPDFDPLGSDLEGLLEVEAQLSTPSGIELTSGAYLLEAVKRG